MPPNPQVPELLAAGKAFADLSDWRKVGLAGQDAAGWLRDLVGVDFGELAPGRSARATVEAGAAAPARFTVAIVGGSVLLLQDPAQVAVLGDVLADRIANAAVRLDDRTAALCLFGFPGRKTAPDAPGTAFVAPSCLGSGVDLVALAEDRDRLRGSLGKAYALASPDDLAAWRAAGSTG